MADEAAARRDAPVALAAGVGASAGVVAALARAPAFVAAALIPALGLLWWALLRPTRWLALFFFAALLLPPLPIALGDTGPHPALLFALLGLAAGMARLRDWRIRPGLLPEALGLLFLVLLASVAMAALYSGAPIAAGTLARVLLFGISVYVFYYLAYGPGRAANSEHFLRILFWCGAASALFACLDFYFQFPAPAGFSPQFVWLPGGVYRRAQGLFYEASTLGNLCAFYLAMILAALAMPRESRPLPRTALACGGVVFSAALLFSYSRASLANVAVAVLALVALRRGRVKWRRFGLFAAMVAAAAALAGWLLPAFAELWWGRLRGTLAFLFSATEAVLSGRAGTWREVVGFLADHPWQALLGVGYKTLPYSRVAGHPIIVDNMYLSLLVETGIVGLAALLLLNFAILRAGWRIARDAEPRRAFLGAWIFCFWAGETLQMFSGDLLTYWRVLPVYFCVLALAVRA